MFTYFLAVSESTPGPIMVNLATYIGVVRAGFWGAVLATFAATLPAFLIILVVAPMMKAFLKNKTVAAIMRGIRPCIIGIILATGVWMMSQSIFPVTGSLSPDWIAIIIAVILGGVYYGYQAQFKHSFSPILLIVIAAGLGIVLYGL
jgi:chromate transporter